MLRLIVTLLLFGCTNPAEIVRGINPLGCRGAYGENPCDVGVFTSVTYEGKCTKVYLEEEANAYLTLAQNEDSCPVCPSEQDRAVTCSFPMEGVRVAIWTREGLDPPPGIGDALPEGVIEIPMPLIEGECPIACE